MACPKTYMLVPHHDFPADGPLHLGNIIMTPKEPGDSLNEDERIEVPDKTIHKSSKFDWEQTIEHAKDGRVDVWARFVQLLGLGTTFGANFDSSTTDHYRFRQLDTIYFSPSQEYIEQAVKTPSVQAYLESARFSPIYIITGLKIVRGPGAQVTRTRSALREGSAKFGLPGFTIPGLIPSGPFGLDAGESTFRQTDDETTSFGGSTDFVFGYRVGRITFEKRAHSNMAPKHQKHVEGAMLGAGFAKQLTSKIDLMNVQLQQDCDISAEFDDQESTTAVDELDSNECVCFAVQSE